MNLAEQRPILLRNKALFVCNRCVPVEGIGEWFRRVVLILRVDLILRAFLLIYLDLLNGCLACSRSCTCRASAATLLTLDRRWQVEAGRKVSFVGAGQFENGVLKLLNTNLGSRLESLGG